MLPSELPYTPTMPARHVLLAITTIAAAATLCSCLRPKTDTAAHPSTRPGNQASVKYRTPFPPADLVIHPLTRFSIHQPSGRPQIEAYIELFDNQGHPVKALGRLTLQLRRLQTSGGAGRQLKLWQIDLTDPAAHAPAYDRITRTYRFLLQDVQALPGETAQLVLQARFEPLDQTAAQALTDEHQLQAPDFQD